MPPNLGAQSGTKMPPAAREPPVDALHLYFAFVDEVATPEHVAECRRWLDAAEQGRADRFYFERDRVLYTVAHALVRSMLGEYLGVNGRALRFRAGAHGRPEVEGPGEGGVSFNLSHTEGLVLLGVAPERAGVGVDAEVNNPRRSGLDIAERFFSAPEFERLAALPQEDQAERFFSLWTLKEAYIKADGAGLTLPLDRFSFSLESPPQLGVTFNASIADSPSRWRFGLCRPSGKHHAAYAMRWDAGGHPRVDCFRMRALGDVVRFEPTWLART